jgi:hypothetical protein
MTLLVEADDAATADPLTDEATTSPDEAGRDPEGVPD